MDKIEDCDKSDYQLLFETCIKDIAHAKDQQWKTIHLTLIALAALLVAINEEMMCVYVSCFFVVAVTFFGLKFLHEHQQALLRYRNQKETIIDNMPDVYRELHPKKENNKDICFFYYAFTGFIIVFGLFALIHAIISYRQGGV